MSTEKFAGFGVVRTSNSWIGCSTNRASQSGQVTKKTGNMFDKILNVQNPVLSITLCKTNEDSTNIQ